MLSHGLQSLFNDISITTTGLVLFLGAHAAIMVRTMWLRGNYAEEAALPLNEEN